MGLLLDDDGNDVHAEARRDSFNLYSDYGHQSVEWPWDRLDEVARLVAELVEYRDANVAPKEPSDE